MKIDNAFPGGNIVFERMEEDSVWLRQDLRDTEGDWFYWYFRVSETAGRTVRFHFTGSRAFAAHGPAVSTDGGRNWRWLGHQAVEGSSFSYTFGPEEKAALFSMTIPYTGADWNSFVRGLGNGRALVETGVLCQSRQGRPVESLRLGCLQKMPEHRVVITARHHCCETMASYALEGLISFVLSDNPEASWLREGVEFLVIPFVDKDGVENGDQGKNRRPRDHNRDYDRESLYPETVALMKTIPSWSQGRLRAVFDLHCPWIADGLNEMLYLVGSAQPRIWQEQKRFGEILERVRTGPLPFRASDSLPYGQDWNTAANYRQGRCFTDWVSEIPEVRLATTLEVPYANACGREVNAGSARRFGADLGQALAAYLKLEDVARVRAIL